MSSSCKTLFGLSPKFPLSKILLGSRGLWLQHWTVKSEAALCLCRGFQTQVVTATASFVPSSQSHAATTSHDLASTNTHTLAVFQKMPTVMPSLDIFHCALKKAKRISPTKGIANIAKRERNRGAKQLDALMKELAVPLRDYVENFPNKKDLHPYERSLIELTLGDGYYEEVLKAVNALRKKVVFTGKEHASHCSKSLSKREAQERLAEGVARLEEVFKHQGKPVDELLNIAKTLRAMPVVDLELPTLCLVGAPNVGKSSLVRILSTGKPEVCNYPFTTRGILMGHIMSNCQQFQVIDTPGLLRRKDEERNNLEKLTLAALSHLPTVVMYVHDLSGDCGTVPSDQFMIYKEIRERFNNHLWLDIISKCDLLQENPVIFMTEIGDSDNFELAKYRKEGPEGSIRVSVKNDEGLTEVKGRVHELLIAQMDRIRRLENGSSQNTEGP